MFDKPGKRAERDIDPLIVDQLPEECETVDDNAALRAIEIRTRMGEAVGDHHAFGGLETLIEVTLARDASEGNTNASQNPSAALRRDSRQAKNLAERAGTHLAHSEAKPPCRFRACAA